LDTTYLLDISLGHSHTKYILYNYFKNKYYLIIFSLDLFINYACVSKVCDQTFVPKPVFSVDEVLSLISFEAKINIGFKT